MLSLEAPLVAVLLQAALARAHGLTLPPVLHTGLAAAAWTIYVLDRTWDALRATPDTLDVRHAFYHRHRWVILLLVLPAAMAWLVWTALHEVPEGIFWQAVSVTVLTALYFGVYLARIAPALMPKPHAASLLFAIGCTSSIRFYSMPETWGDPVLECAMLSLLVLSNLSAIAAREEEVHQRPPRWSGAHAFMLKGNLLVITVMLACMARGLFDPAMLAPGVAILMSLTLLAVLHRVRTRFSEEAHLVLADLAVIAPLPLVWLFSR